MDAQSELRFKQPESAIEDQLILISMGDDQNLKPIFMSKNLQNLIRLIHEYIDDFAWNYKDMSGLDLKIAQHHISGKLDTKQTKQ